MLLICFGEMCKWKNAAFIDCFNYRHVQSHNPYLTFLLEGKLFVKQTMFRGGWQDRKGHVTEALQEEI
jgi:hypothetical protein